MKVPFGAIIYPCLCGTPWTLIHFITLTRNAQSPTSVGLEMSEFVIQPSSARKTKAFRLLTRLRPLKRTIRRSEKTSSSLSYSRCRIGRSSDAGRRLFPGQEFTKGGQAHPIVNPILKISSLENENIYLLWS
jgi:hypothetical protein